MRRLKPGQSTEDLRHLIQSPSAFIKALKANPELVNKQDKNGRTLLHHFAEVDNTSTEAVLISLWHHILLAKPRADIKDKKGNTALHIVAVNIDKKFNSGWLMPALISLFESQKIDLKQKNTQGLTFNDLLSQNREREYYHAHGKPHPLAELQQQRRRDVVRVTTFMKMELLDEANGLFNENLNKLPATEQRSIIEYLIAKFSAEQHSADPSIESKISELDEYGIFLSIEQSIAKIIEESQIDQDLIDKMRADITNALKEFLEMLEAKHGMSATTGDSNTVASFTYANSATSTSITLYNQRQAQQTSSIVNDSNAHTPNRL